MLTVKLAEAIVAETMKRVQWNINMMDSSGKIIASGDRTRVGQLHPGAEKAVRTGNPVYITADEAISLPEAQAGINCPIKLGREVVGVIGITGPPSQIEPVSQLLVMTAEMMIQQAQTVVQEEWRQTNTELLLREMFSDAPRMERIELHAQSLHFPLTAPFHIAIFQTWSPHAPKESPTHDHVLRLLTDSNKPRSHMITAKLEPDRYILAFAGTREDNIRSTLEWLLQLAEDFYPVVGVSSPAKQISDIRTALTEAQLALDLRLPSVPFPSHVQPAKQKTPFAFDVINMKNRIIFYPEIEGQAMMQLIPKVHRERLRERLSPHWNKRLQETLEAYFACNLNMAQAAQQLGVHRNTIIYRLQQCRERTGYNPEVFHDALLLQCMIWMEEAADK